MKKSVSIFVAFCFLLSSIFAPLHSSTVNSDDPARRVELKEVNSKEMVENLMEARREFSEITEEKFLEKMESIEAAIDYLKDEGKLTVAEESRMRSEVERFKNSGKGKAEFLKELDGMIEKTQKLDAHGTLGEYVGLIAIFGIGIVAMTVITACAHHPKCHKMVWGGLIGLVVIGYIANQIF